MRYDSAKHSVRWLRSRSNLSLASLRFNLTAAVLVSFSGGHLIDIIAPVVPGRRAVRCLLLVSVAALASSGRAQQGSPSDIVLKNATVMTASHGTIEKGSVWVHAGKIAGVGTTVNAPSSAAVIDG